MSFAEIHALFPVLILALGATGILMLGAWWPARTGWIMTGVVLSLAAAVAAAVVVAAAAVVAVVAGASVCSCSRRRSSGAGLVLRGW